MTIDILEGESPVVVESAQSITTTAETEMATSEPTELLDEKAIAQLAALYLSDPAG